MGVLYVGVERDLAPRLLELLELIVVMREGKGGSGVAGDEFNTSIQAATVLMDGPVSLKRRGLAGNFTFTGGRGTTSCSPYR